MPFDPNSARPVFDPATAKPATTFDPATAAPAATAFDPNSAKPADAGPLVPFASPEGPTKEAVPVAPPAGGNPLSRIVDAGISSAVEGFGDRPLGFSPETMEEMRKSGFILGYERSVMDPIRLFNETLVLPSIAVGDAALRGIVGAYIGGAGAVGQAAEETGLGSGSRLKRDLIMMPEAFAGSLGRVNAYASRGRAARTVEDAAIKDAPEAAGPAARATEPPAAALVPERDARKPFGATAEQPQAAASGAPRPEFAGNINLDRIYAPEDVKDVIRSASKIDDGFETARRGKISLEETEQLAASLGMSADDLAKRKIGQAFNAEEATAARNLLVDSANRVHDLAKRAQGGADADLAALQEAVTRHVAIQEQVSGMTAEAGRALSAFRIMAGEGDKTKDLARLIQSSGGRDRIDDLARKISVLDTPEAVSVFAREAYKAKTSDMLLEAWINALLSGPQTHAVNMLSNSLVAAWSIPETAVAAGIGRVRGSGAAERVAGGEAAARAFGAIEGMKDGLRAGAKTFMTETPSGLMGKMDQPRLRAIPSMSFKVGGREIEIGGRQVRIPGRALMAEDEFFKSIGYRQEINALAYRQAASEGLSGKAFAERVSELRTNPTDDMLNRARDAAEYQTFTNPLGPFGQKVQGMVTDVPALRVIMPFIRTPANIVKFAAERSPFGLLMKDVRDNLKGAQGKAAQDMQIARLAVGSSASAMAASLALDGTVTGAGPVDPQQRAMLYLSGWQPYSVRVGETYYSYGRLEPLGMLLGISADMVAVSDAIDGPDADKLAALITGSVSKNLVSKTWLSGLSDLIQAVQDPDRYGERWVQRLAGTLVPTGVAQAARVEDPYLREAQGIVDVWKSRIPGLSDDLLPRRDVWGEPIMLEGGVGPDIVSPIYQSKLSDDPVNRELIALGVFPSRLDKRIRGVELSPEQYEEFQKIAGPLTKHTLDNLVSQPNWPSIPVFARQEIVGRTINETRSAARMMMLARYPEIASAIAQSQVEKITDKPE